MRHPTVTNRIQFKKMRALAQRTQKDAQKTSWMNYVSTINSYTEYGKIWKRVDKIKGKHRPRPTPTLKINNEKITEPGRVATTLAEHYSATSVKTKNLYTAEYRRSLTIRKQSSFKKRGGHPDNQALNAPFTMAEMESQLDRSKDSAPGPEKLNHLDGEAPVSTSKKRATESLEQAMGLRTVPRSVEKRN